MWSETPNNVAAKTKSGHSTPILWLRPIVSIFIIILVVLLTGNTAVKPSCGAAFRKDTTLVTSQNQDIYVEVASDSASQQEGLSGRSCLPPRSGMLFSFAQPGYYQFWMKDMKMPLDMVWISSDHRIVTVRPDLLPSTYPNTFTGTSPAKYVLEIAAGQASSLDLSVGSSITF